ncbi:MAG: diaminopimelate decarboxylase [Bacteroidales bacterium]|nr:diaminopimelate decarboxylase [Bacteroidales bacterium]
MTYEYKLQKLDLVQIANQFGTPLYVYDAEKIKERINYFKSCFSGVNLKVKYATKSLSNINILKLMKKEGLGLDTVSIQEIYLGLKAGFSPEQIVFTPNIIDFDSIKEAVELGVSINIENLSNLEKFGKEYGNTKACCIRLNPNILFEIEKQKANGIDRTNINKEHYSKIDDGRKSVWHNQSKFGISLTLFDELMEIINRYQICVNGLHIHASHVIMNAEMFMKNAKVMFDLSKHFPHLQYFDFGGGLMVPHKPNDEIVDVHKLGCEFEKEYNKFCKQHNKNFEIWFEPGRFLVSEAGYLLAKADIVKTNGSFDFVGINTGFHHLIRPMMYDAYHEIINISNHKGVSRKYTVVGNLCEIDNMGKDRMLNEVNEGDILMIKNAGAYGISMASNYNSNYRPPEVLILDGEAKLIRKQESFDDIIRNMIEIEI